MQVVEAPVASRTDGHAELKQQLDAADADIVLVNERLDEAQGEWPFWLSSHNKSNMMPVFLICCDCRWSGHRGDPSGGTCPSQRTSKE